LLCTISSLFLMKNDASSAVKFLLKALKAKHIQQPRVINADTNAVYTIAVEGLKQGNILNKETQLRQVKYLNNRIEQDCLGIVV
jgi:transposase, IS6 family